MIYADKKIYLASKSPRRRELLRQIGIEFELLMLRDEPGRPGFVSEIPHNGEAPEDYVIRIAREKAESGWSAILGRRLPQRPVLAADTTVTIDGKTWANPPVLRKPSICCACSQAVPIRYSLRLP